MVAAFLALLLIEQARDPPAEPVADTPHVVLPAPLSTEMAPSSDADTQGTATEADIAPLDGVKHKIEACLRIEMNENNRVPPQPRLEYVIDDDGFIAEVRLLDNALRERPVEECIANVLFALEDAFPRGERRRVEVRLVRPRSLGVVERSAPSSSRAPARTESRADSGRIDFTDALTVGLTTLAGGCAGCVIGAPLACSVALAAGAPVVQTGSFFLVGCALPTETGLTVFQYGAAGGALLGAILGGTAGVAIASDEEAEPEAEKVTEAARLTTMLF